TPKKTFATAVDWPGWSRSGKTPEAALEALLGYRDRYASAVAASGQSPPADPVAEIVESADGGSGTEFGGPSRVAVADREPLDAAEAARRTAIVEVAWATFDRIVAMAPCELRKGPRGGGRDRDKIAHHVNDSDGYYAKELGIPGKAASPTDAAAVATQRAAML